ncbi:holin [Enterococcus sp. N249-2]
MKAILIAASVIAPLVVGVTGLIKTQVKNYDILPVINVIAGILLGVLFALSFVQEDLVLYAWAGAVAGLAASGLFDLGSTVINHDTQPPDYGDGQSETEKKIYRNQDQSKG